MTPRTLVIACGALINELQAVRDAHALIDLDIECLPASYHLHPEKIGPGLRKRLDRSAHAYDRILIGYGDCGTAGAIDDLCTEYTLTQPYQVERIAGDHCYAFFAGLDRFRDLHDGDPTVFYLTDFLARHFDLFVMDGLGINAHPQLLEAYFGNYTRVVYLAQTDNAELNARAEAAATRLGLAYERIFTGYGDLNESVVHLTRGATDHDLEEYAV
ncbi:MAG: DUF1638 domain-containing protein [Actinomycetota bacterium]